MELITRRKNARSILGIFIVLGWFSQSLFGQCPPTITPHFRPGSNAIYLSSTREVKMCAGDTVVLKASPSQAPGLTYIWYKGGIAISGEDKDSLVVSISGNYRVRVNGGGCTDWSEITKVTVNPLPVITITPNIVPPHICAGDPIQLTVSTSPSSGVNWVWMQPSSIMGQSVNPLTIGLFGTTNFQVIGVNTNQSPQCTNSANLQVLVDYPIDGGQIGESQTICAGETPAPLTSMSSPTGGSGVYTYKWGYSYDGSSFSLIPGATGPDYSPGPLTQTTYFCRFAYSEPCAAGGSNVVMITVNEIPAITSTTSRYLCSGSQLDYWPQTSVPWATVSWTATCPSGNVSGFSAFGYGSIHEVLTLNPGVTSPADVIYTMTPTGPGPTYCQGDPVDLVVTVFPIPEVTNTVTSQTICSGDNSSAITLNSNIAGTNFSWTVSAPNTISGYTASGTGNIPSWTLYSISLVPEDVVITVIPETGSPMQCQGPAFTYTITVNPAPTITNSPLYQAVCSNQPSTEVILTSNVSGTTFSWTATADPPNLTGWIPSGTSIIPSQTIINPNNVPGTITFHINPSGTIGGCAPASRDYVIEVGPVPAVNSPLTGEVCSGGIFNYSMSSNVANCSFQWNRAPVSGITPPSSSGINPNISETLYNNTSNNLNAVYQITPTSPAPFYCTGDPTDVVVTVRPLPQVNAGTDKTIPFGTSTDLSGSATSINGLVNVTWLPPSNVVPPNNQLNIQTTNLYANTEFTLQATDNAGCTASDNVWVYLSGSALNVAPGAASGIICQGGSTQLNANVSGGSGNYTYSWTPATGLNNPTIADPVASPLSTTTYTVTVNDGYNTVSGQVTVEVIQTPNPYQVGGGGEYCSGGTGVSITLNGSTPGVEYSLWLNGSIVSGSGIFGNGAPLTWNNITTPGTYTVQATLSGCPGIMNGSATVQTLPLPTPYTLTGGGSYPQGGAGVPIGISGSESGFVYFLELVGVGVVPPSPVQGNGGPLSFGLQTAAGTYQVKAVNPATSCESYMSGTVTVSVNPTPTVFNMTGGGEGCENTSGVSVGLSGSEIGIIYYLYKNNLATGEAFNGTGNALDFGPRGAGAYSCKAYNPNTGVWTDMNGVALVTIHTTPVVYQLVPSGQACPGTEIRLNGSEAGVEYTLWLNNNIMGTAAGTGSIGFLSFGNYTEPGTYYVVATHPITGCTDTMSGTLEILPFPLAYNVLPQGILCDGESVELSGSQTGVMYQLRRADTINVGLPVAGNGQPLSFGPQNYPGIYKVYAWNTSSLCGTWMNGQTYLDTLPTPYSITPNGTVCGPVEIGLNGSHLGYTYYLYHNGVTPALMSLPGTGGPLNFGTYYASGNYVITAKDEYLHCESSMSGVLTLKQLPQAYQVLPQGITCAPAEVSLILSEPGVVYQLLNNGLPTVPPTFVSGTGGPLSFGMRDEGMYTVSAVNSDGCSALMSGSAQLLPGPVVHAGTDASICETQIYQASAQASNYSNLQWITTGDGLFSNSSVLNPTYTPGPNDILNGNVQLVLKAFAGSQCPGVYAADTLLLTIHRMPSIDAGPDLVACEGNNVQPVASASGYQFLYWTTTGDGSFDNPSSLSPPYTPGPGDISAGGVYLILFATGTSSCSAWYMADSVWVNVIQYPFIEAGDNQTICQGDQVYLNASAQNYTNLQWTTSGSGIFSNPFILNPIYTPSQADRQSGQVILTLHAYRSSAQCAMMESTDDMIVTIVPMATVNAGGTDENCASSPYLTHATATHASAFHWKTSGDGLFIDPYSLNTTYLPGNLDVANGQVDLTLTAYGSYGCATDSVSSTLLLSISGYPSANAGPDGLICASGTFTPAASVHNVSSLVWGTSGDGQFNDISLLNPVYTPGIQDKNNGVVALYLLATGDGACSNVTATDTLVLQIHPVPVVNAGTDATICASATLQTQAQCINCSGVTWMSSGDGWFSNSHEPVTTYYPGNNDKNSGIVTLTLRGNGTSVCSNTVAEDQLVLTILPLPQVDAGNDVHVCYGEVASLSAMASNYTVVEWSTQGDGTFLNPGSLVTTYQPGTGDLASGYADLTIKVFGEGLCSNDSATDFIRVWIDPLPSVNAGIDDSLCHNATFLTQASAINAAAYSWFTSGNGSFGNPSALNTFYTPGSIDLLNGFVTLTLQVTGKQACSSVVLTDNMRLDIIEGPAAQAGNDRIVCASENLIQINGSAQNYSQIQWITSGTGSFSNPGSLTTTYTFSPADKAAGQIFLILKATGRGRCLGELTFDTLVVTLSPLPVANAGEDEEICAGEVVTLDGTAGNYSSVLWTTSGDGVFSNPSVLNPVYSPGPQDRSNGSVVLTLKAMGAAPCQTQMFSDQKEVQIHPLPTAILSGDNTICEGESSLLTVQFTGTPPWYLTYTDGNQVFTLNGIWTSSIQWAVSPSTPTTYTLLEVTDAHCSGSLLSGSATIQVNPRPTAFILSGSNNGNFCTGGQGSELLLNNSEPGINYQLYRGSQIMTSPIAGTGSPISFGFFNTPGDYYVIGFNDTTGCSREMNGHVTVNAWPLPVVNFTADTACLGHSTNFILTGNNLSEIAQTYWDFGDGLNALYAGAAGTTHIYGDTGVYQASVSVTDVNGCSVSVNHTIKVQALPVALFSNTYPSCVGEAISFTNLSYTTSPDIIHTWIWDFGDGSQRQTINWPANPNTLHVYAQSGTYTVKLIVYSQQGCVDSSVRQISILPIPVVDFAWNNNCQSLLTQFTDLTQTGTGINPIAWQWNFGDPSSGTANFAFTPYPVHLYNQPGTYNVSLDVMTSQGCSAMVTKQVTIYPSPVAQFTFDTACLGQHTHFTDLSTSTSPILSWDWDFGDGSAHSSLQNPDHLYAAAGMYNVKLVVTDIQGCTAEIIRQVKVEDLPYAAFTFSSPNCAGQEVQFVSQSSVSQGYIASWEWQFGDGSTQLIQHPANPNTSHIYSSPGNYTVTLTVTAASGCQQLAVHQVEVQPNPMANFTFPDNNCEQSAVTFTNTSLTNGGAPFSNWYWDFGDPLSGNNNISYLPSPTHIYNEAGTYDVMLVAFNSAGCSDTVIRQVVVSDLPTASFTAPEVCLGEPTQFTSTSTPNSGALMSFDWDFGDGSPHSNIANPQHLYNASGTYQVTLTVTNTPGCISSITQPVAVNALPQSAFQVSLLNCEGAEVNFDDQSTASQGYITQWIWDFGDGSSVTINFPDLPDVTHVYANAGTYLATLTVTTNLGCQHSSSQTLTVAHAPVANFIYSNNCQGQAVFFTDQSQLNGGGILAGWLWDFGDPASGNYNTSTQQNPMHIFTGAGTYNVKLIVTNIGGCTDTIIKPVDVAPAPVAQFTADSACLGNPTHFQDLSVPNASSITTWLWSFGDGYSSTLQNPEHTYSSWGTYTVTLSVTNSNGCQHDTAMQVMVKPLPTTAFTYQGSCTGSATQFSDLSSTPQGAIVQWDWQFGDGSTSNQQNPEHVYATGGTYTVTLTTTNSLGCTSFYQQMVNLYNAPTAAFNAYSVFCPKGQVSFQDISNGNGVPVTWRLWDFGNGFTSQAANPVNVYSITDTCYTVTFIAGNAYGCSDTTSQVVCVKPGFDFTIQADPGCVGTPTQFQAVNLAQGDTLQYVRWYFGDPASGSLNLSTSHNPEHVYQQTGTYLVMLKAWNSDNCVDSVYRLLEIVPPPLAQFSYLENIPHCDTTLTFGNQVITYGVELDSLVWNFGDGSIERQQKPVPSTITHRFPAYGSYQVSLSAYAENRCFDQISKMVTVKCLTASFTSDTLVCTNMPLTLKDISGPEISITHWLWLFGDGQYLEYTSRQPEISHVYHSPGNYPIKLVVSGMVNGQNVQDSISRMIYVLPGPLASFEASRLCMGDTVLFVDKSVAAYDSILSWKWKFGDGKISLERNPGHVYPTYSSLWNVELEVSTYAGCRDTATKAIQLEPKPVVMLSPSQLLYCGEMTDIEFQDTSGVAYKSYQWIWGDGDTTYTAEPQAIHAYASGVFSPRLEVETEGKCRGIAEALIKVRPSPVAEIYLDKNSVSVADPVINFADRSQAGNSPVVQWQWYLQDTVEISTKQAFPMNFGQPATGSPVLDPGTYKVTLWVTNAEGCSDSASAYFSLVSVPMMFVPNAFSPDGDGTNDLFIPKISNYGSEGYTLRIYNRWGLQVFETNDINAGWDGTFKGSPCPAGTYLWVVSLKTSLRIETIKGSVILIR